ncbi:MULTISPECIES: Wzz/FepE/Etk N-terminal domain-containing protein [unclassified Arsukibacterium]|uniref:Wzz/FepE/Etk N-terminal domain-containing protein n=1 Tax=unclassified Arsukibacterium TaxID=2635278 RepID=UPI000C8B306E|nr:MULTISPECIES: Wzz/FepE/Etk N-terminal domain-containing protein [unclassified Arsukibacterium]MAA96144.1 LPS O-antigen length regulator [Rheinheimera sp.]|tara:strand:+ start:27531 stop:28487 length:957 start_codon:yes stop_codon:yes gene_type:complete
MTEQVLPQQQAADDEIDLRELFRAIWQGKWIIIATTFVFAVAAVFYALSLPNIYKSEALLAPVSEDAGLKIPGQLGGLAALAGVNLGGGGADKTGLAIEILKSRDFIGRFIEKHDLYLPVMAAEGWSRNENSLVIDPEIYNTETKEWVREVNAPFQPKPSVLETFDEFKKLFSVSQDKTTGMVKVTMEHYSPYLAKIWVDKLVKTINDEMRSRELIEAKKSIDYLTDQINQTNIADVRTMLFSLIEEQTKTLMLANVRDEYIFKTIDPAVVAERKSKPRRSLVVFSMTILGFFLSILIVFLIRLFFSKKYVHTHSDKV